MADIELSNGEIITDVFVFGANNGGGGLNLMVELLNGRSREVSLSDVYRITYPNRKPCKTCADLMRCTEHG